MRESLKFTLLIAALAAYQSAMAEDAVSIIEQHGFYYSKESEIPWSRLGKDLEGYAWKAVGDQEYLVEERTAFPVKQLDAFMLKDLQRYGRRDVELQVELVLGQKSTYRFRDRQVVIFDDLIGLDRPNIKKFRATLPLLSVSGAMYEVECKYKFLDQGGTYALVIKGRGRNESWTSSLEPRCDLRK